MIIAAGGTIPRTPGATQPSTACLMTWRASRQSATVHRMTETAIPLDRASLRGQGLSQSQIDHAVRRGLLVATQRGILIPARALSAYDVRCRAALTTQRDDAVVWRRSAAVIQGLPCVPTEWTEAVAVIEVAAQRDDLTRSSRRGMQRRICRLEEIDVAVVGGMRVTTVARTLEDLSRDHPRWLMVGLMDAAVQAGRCSVDDLHAVLPRLFGLRGVIRARNAVLAVRPGVDSPVRRGLGWRSPMRGSPNPICASSSGTTACSPPEAIWVTGAG
jgi:hypothetical protein